MRDFTIARGKYLVKGDLKKGIEGRNDS